jgi:hypothetical protein
MDRRDNRADLKAKRVLMQASTKTTEKDMPFEFKK